MYSADDETPIDSWTAEDGVVEYITNLGDGASWTGKFVYDVPKQDADGNDDGVLINGIDLARGMSIVIR